MKRTDMGAYSRKIAEMRLGGTTLGNAIADRIENRPLADGWPEEMRDKITSSEIIDSLETFEQAQDVCKAIVERYKALLARTQQPF